MRTVLDEELGLEPGGELRSLQTAVLRQDPALAWTPPPGGGVAVAAPVAPEPVDDRPHDDRPAARVPARARRRRRA